jgi:hypothetical protein
LVCFTGGTSTCATVCWDYQGALAGNTTQCSCATLGPWN